ncbi:zinc-ribbon domain-containing protein [Frigidibacter sp.]|uniref:zinc-ribbon domain-containing protein n=1 Tax=Frigidibacter sp. TaxID=2586418 RepID=UPI00273710C5|nr:zinc-ribbon domain-containing protein [Frigidibacter sp.]MDP3341596.1 zinc-ribbon domain-containing protein [Frigidibacter sp.]
MRLTCPNCAAQYEVDDRVIPAAGRDVQCSNCGQAWFQPPAGAEFAETPEPEADLPFENAAFAAEPLPEAPAEADDLHEPEDPAWPDLASDLDLSGSPDLSTEAEAALAAALDDTPEPTLVDEPESWPADEWTEDQTTLPAATEVAEPMPAAGLAAAAMAANPPPARPEGELRRRSIDEAVLSVLREEAEREVRARRGETPGLETQAELPLAPATPPRRERPAPVIEPADATERGATLRGEDPELEAEIAAANRPPRRELLPDIEEINSTLRATSERGREAAAVDAPETLRRRRSGFRLGFGLSLSLVLVLLSVYLSAPRLAAQLPGAAPALASYVGAVDRGRIWLDRTVATRIEALSTSD